MSLLSCREPTQLALVFTGSGFECAPILEEHELYAETALRVAPQVAGLFESQDGSTWRVCEGGDATDGRVALGDVVLVPGEERGGPIEILAVVSLDGASTEECVAEYEAFLLEQKAEGEGSLRCIVARRSLGFVPYSSLQLGIEFDSRCAGVLCEGSQTCSAGACVSATVECTEAGCEEGGGGGGGGAAGGAGAGGAGAMGGAGGTAGAGGESIVWERLELAGDPFVYDVVALVGGNPGAPRFRIGAATEEGVFDCVEGTRCFERTNSTILYRAIAAEGRVGPGLAAYGPNGWWSTAAMGGLGQVNASRYDVAWPGTGLVELVFARDGATCELDPASLELNLPASCGVAVAGSSTGSIVVAAGARVSWFANAATTATDSFFFSYALSGPWTLWIPTGVGAPGGNPFPILAARGLSDDASNVWLIAAQTPGTPPPLPPPNAKVVDLAGDTDAPTWIYAVGAKDGGPWLGRLQVPDGTLWEDLAGPDGVGPEYRSVGIAEVDGVPWIAIGAGDDGLFRARLDEVLPR